MSAPPGRVPRLHSRRERIEYVNVLKSANPAIVKRVPAAPAPAAAAASPGAEKRSRTNTRARLLTAAYTEFCDRGFQATTVEHVCRRAGFTRGAFYSNFSTTEELFLALWDQQADRIIDGARALVELLAVVDDPLETTQSALADLEHVEPRWFLLNTEFMLHVARHPEVAAELGRHRSRLRAELGAVLTTMLHAVHRRLPPDVDIDLFTRMVIAAHEGCQHQSRVAGHELAPGALQRAMLTLLVTACPQID